MRKAVGAAALLILVLCVVLLTLPAQKAPEKSAALSPGEQFSVGIRLATLADEGNQSAAVMRLYLQSDGNTSLLAFCQPRPVQRNVLLLSHASVPGMDANLARKIGTALSKVGVSTRGVTLREALDAKNSVIISPAGAIPLSIWENIGNLSEQNTRVVAVEYLAGRTIDEKGDVRQANQSMGAPMLSIARLEPGGEESAVERVVALVLAPPEAGDEWEEAPAGNRTVAIRVEGNETQCRVVARTGERARFADTDILSAAPGRLYGPQAAYAGKDARFEFRVASEQEEGRVLRFTATAEDDEGNGWKKQLAGGEITEGWASRFSANFSRGGEYLVRVSDQFGRQHAIAHVRVMGLDVKPVSQDGTRFEFKAALGGAPASGKISAWIDDGERRDYSAGNGTLVIWAAPAPGKRVMHFDFSGADAQYAFEAQQNGFIENYARYAIPGIILLAAFYFLLRAGRKAKYTIAFPDAALADQKVAPIDSNAVLLAWKKADEKLGAHRLAAYPHEIAACLDIRIGGERVQPDPSSVLYVLRTLSSEGKFVEFEGAFIPSEETGAFSAWQLGALRLIHDLMLERGIRFERKKILLLPGKRLELALFEGNGLALAHMRKGAVRAIVFPSDEEKDEFESRLREGGQVEAKIGIAIDNGAVILAAASRKDLELLLP